MADPLAPRAEDAEDRGRRATIGTLTLNRPDDMNAMNPELIFELTVAAAWLADRAPFRALVVTGSGRAFSAGGDVNWFKKGVEDRGSTCPPTCAAAPRCCTRRSSTSAASPTP